MVFPQRAPRPGPMPSKSGSPLENILALYRTAGSLREVDDEVFAAGSDDKPSEKVNVPKLF